MNSARVTGTPPQTLDLRRRTSWPAAHRPRSGADPAEAVIISPPIPPDEAYVGRLYQPPHK